MRALLAMGLLMTGCAPSLGVPLEGTDGVLRCYDGDRVTEARPVCDTAIAVRNLGGVTGCTRPDTDDADCVTGVYCARYPERCTTAFCAVLPSLDDCEAWVDRCAELGATECVVEANGTVRVAD